MPRVIKEKICVQDVFNYEVMRFLLRLCLISELEIVLDEFILIFLRKVEARQDRIREGKAIESD